MASSARAPAQTFVELGNVLVELGDRKNAILALERAEKLQPGTVLTSLARGKISYFEGDFPAAEKYLSRYLIFAAKTCDAYSFLGLAPKGAKESDFGSRKSPKGAGTLSPAYTAAFQSR